MGLHQLFYHLPPGRESDTFNRLQKFIKESVPEFQTVTGERIGSATPGKAGK